MPKFRTVFGSWDPSDTPLYYTNTVGHDSLVQNADQIALHNFTTHVITLSEFPVHKARRSKKNANYNALINKFIKPLFMFMKQEEKVKYNDRVIIIEPGRFTPVALST